MRSVEDLHPAYFALVMATGIVSIAADINGMHPIGLALFWLNVIAYGALWILVCLRLARYPRRFLGDISDHARGPGFFTWVAGSGVLGAQFSLIVHNELGARVLWFVTVVLWLLVMYAIFTALSVKEDKPGLDRGLNGGWLVGIVATQSVAILSTIVAPTYGAHERPLLFLALVMWLFGGMLYIWIISLIFYRYTFVRFGAADLTPPYWINMGAMAISTLAGAGLIGASSSDPLLGQLDPFLKGFTLFFWATGTWWIPMLVFLGVWRYFVKRFPFGYDPLYWGGVFPLGMYTVCTYRMAEVMQLDFIDFIPKIFVFIALGAWALTAVGWIWWVFRPLSLRTVLAVRKQDPAAAQD